MLCDVTVSTRAIARLELSQGHDTNPDLTKIKIHDVSIEDKVGNMALCATICHLHPTRSLNIPLTRDYHCSFSLRMGSCRFMCHKRTNREIERERGIHQWHRSVTHQARKQSMQMLTNVKAQ